MNSEFSETRSSAIRTMLIEQARPERKRRLLWSSILLAAGVIVGAGASTAAFAAGGGFSPAMPSQTTADGMATTKTAQTTAAPLGLTPGAPVIVVLSDPLSQTVSAKTRIPFHDRPAEATHVRVMVTPLSAGSISWGTDPGGNNPSSFVQADEIGSGRGLAAWYDFSLDATTDALYLEPSSGMSASVTYQYLHETPTRLGVNARGETYGAEGGPDGSPDLIHVAGISPSGGQVFGYARAADLNAFSPEHPELPSNPEEAVRLQSERDAKYPDGWDIPVFESDGETQIGRFHIG